MGCDVDTTFANWNQLVAAIARVKEEADDTPAVDEVLQTLSQISTPEIEDFLPEPPTLWTVGRLRFTIEQEGHGPKVQET